MREGGRIRAVVFDIGGVLEVSPDGQEPSHSFDGVVAGWEARLGIPAGALAAHFASVREDGAVGRYTEEEWREGLRVVTGADPADLAALVQDCWDLYLGELNTELARYFRELRPRYRTALLSNSFVGARWREEERYGYSEMTELIVYSHEEGVEKPDRRIYEVTCERLGLEPEAIVFLDDVESYLAGARAVGMHAVLYEDNAQAIAEIEALLRGGE